MSQVTFQYTSMIGAQIEVVAGWDHVVGFFFMFIENLETSRLEFTNLNLRGATTIDKTDIFRRELEKRHISPPEGFWELVERKEGQVKYTLKDGAWEKEC